MIQLSPQQAASIAMKVYDVRVNLIDLSQISPQQLGVMDMFVLENSTRFDGTSGNIFFNAVSGFGYVAKGVGSRQDEALIAIRGTAPLAADWFTNINFAIENGPSGYPVHAGFNQTFKSFKVNLANALEKIRPKGVHVVGHSLGGALATLTADFVCGMGKEVKLYTFGSPRSGTLGHATYLTGALSADNIYRVHHCADPVTMVPIFPYLHAPITNDAYFLPWPGSISASSHFMESYFKSIGKADWLGLKRLAPAPGFGKQAAEYLEALSAEGGVRMLCAASLWLILQALQAVLRSVAMGVGVCLTAGATVVDRLAQLLYTGTLLSVHIAEQVQQLMEAILKFLGRAVNGVRQQITVAFISWVLETLFRMLATSAKASLDRLDNTRY
jgi:triacylglycerol lipase